MSFTSNQFKNIAISAAQLADQKKAEDILLLDLRKAHSGVADFIVIASANSQTHLNALKDHIEDSLGDIGVLPAHKEGQKENAWQVLDYGGVLIHIFHEGVRRNYSIERLWEQAKPMNWGPSNGNGNGNGHPHRFPTPSRKSSAKPRRSRSAARRRVR